MLKLLLKLKMNWYLQIAIPMALEEDKVDF